MKPVKKVYFQIQAVAILPVKLLFTVSILLLVSFSARSQIYVDSSAIAGLNTGTSWDDAFTDLQQAFATAQSGDSIWVAAGTYYPSDSSGMTPMNPRNATFHLKDSVAIYGGFAGGETTLSERDWETHETILSGDINQSDSLDGNSYTLVTGSGTDSTAVMDGFTIIMGNSNGTGGSFGNPNSYGGGMYNNAGSPTVTNCTFSGNSALSAGGGMFNNVSSPTITNCIFSGNTSEFDGGGIYNSESNMTLTNSAVIGNVAIWGGARGGGILIVSSSSPTISDNLITGNESGFRGGGIYIWDSTPNITNNTISENINGGILNQDSSPLIESCSILENDGIGIYNRGNSNPTIIDNIISGNHSTGIVNDNSHPSITNCVISDNEGSGIENDDSDPTITNCTITGNSTNYDGGGIANWSSNATIVNCIISGNQADNGGGIVIWNGNPTIINCIISGNQAEYGGGGITIWDASPIITNSTISGNLAVGDGGGIDNFNGSPIISNSIIWNNSANGSPVSTSASVFNGGSSNPTFSNSLIANSSGSGNWVGAIGLDNGNNIDTDPLFVEDLDPANAPDTLGNFRLTPCSPAIDRGDNTALTASDSLDLAENQRLHNATGADSAIVDMGAYEFQGSVPMGNPHIIYVDSSNTTPGNGLSWDCAYTDLQQALAIAQPGDSIWVAAGTYYPSDSSGMTPMNPRNATFQLKDSIAIYGGFAGGETTLSERDWETHETILSGDINQSDSLDGNSYTVVTGSGADSTAVMDGIIITGGNANAIVGLVLGSNKSGGGIYIQIGSPTIANCTIRNNWARNNGGGIYVNFGAPLIFNCTINQNFANNGGGVHNRNFGNSLISDCEISNNHAYNYGGGVYNNNSSPGISNCTIGDNEADLGGGGIFNEDSSSPNITDCKLSGNETVSAGGGIYNYSSDPSILNCVINENVAEIGGGIYNYSSNPSILNSEIHGNVAEDGGGLYSHLSNPSLSTVTINGNVADNNGGGIFNGYSSNPILMDVILKGNTAELYGGGYFNGEYSNPSITKAEIDSNSAQVGGGFYNSENSSPLLNSSLIRENFANFGGGIANLSDSIFYITDCKISGNVADENGGGIYNFVGKSVISKSTISGNIADMDGGGIFNYGSSPDLITCLIIGNEAGNNGGGVLNTDYSSPVITNSTISGNSAGFDGGGIFNFENSDPVFSNTIIWNNAANWDAYSTSASIHNGYASYAEFSNSLIANSGGSESWDNDIGVDGGNNFDADPLFVEDLDPANAPDTLGNFRLTPCSPAIDRGDNTALTTSDSLDLAENQRLHNATGADSAIVDMGAYEFQGSAPETGNPNVIYVNASNVIPGTGLSWDCAFTDLQQALDIAESGDSIWVAAGTYYPSDSSGMTPMNPRNATFQLKDSVAIYGGFAGGETTLSERDWETHETILSGDINQSDSLDGNSYTVVTGSGTDSTAVMDGFNITLGNADATSGPIDNPNRSGGGMYNDNGSPTITNSTFSGNSANYAGGGMYNFESSPVITNSTFSGNSAKLYGGGMFNDESSPAITNSTFSGNSANSWGGGILNDDSSPLITNSTFPGNEAFNGGGMYNRDNSSPVITNSTFSGNSANSLGGGMFNFFNSSPVITNSTFSGNSADFGGGGMYNRDNSSPVITNSTFSGNSANSLGGGMFNFFNSSPVITNSTFSGNSASDGGGMFNDDSSPAITYSTFSGNSADFIGGGILNDDSSPLITNSTFSGNSAVFGGGMYNFESSPVITNSTFSGNSASDGGGMFNDDSSPAITYSTFSGNSANSWGGGILNDDSSPLITNSTFSGNSAVFGGGMFNHDSSPLITNSTFSGNSASDGGGMFNFFDSSPLITNSVIWNNSANGSTVSTSASVFDIVSSNLTFSYSLVANSGGSGSWDNAIGMDGGNNIDVDPLFVQDVDLDSVPTASGNLRLQACSPAIDAGDNSALSASDTLDLEGNPRFHNATAADSAIVDMGAYEFQGTVDKCDCIIQSVVFVDSSAVAGGNGLSWATAFKDLQDALDFACSCNDSLNIWIAQGTYYPDRGVDVNLSDRNATFQLCNNVALYGGFSGGETSLSERNWEVNETILSGDINQSGSFSGNSYTVVTGSGTDSTSIIDGITITGGNANVSSTNFNNPNQNGGGMFNNGGSPTIVNCIIRDNIAIYAGGGIYNRDNSNPSITNCIISNNSVDQYGGGIYNFNQSSPSISNSTIYGNEAFWGGGILNDFQSAPWIISSSISGNIAVNGGGIYIWNNSSSTIVNCMISGNMASGFGGGIYNVNQSSPYIINCTISGNSAGINGGGIRNTSNSHPEMVNTIIWNNSADGNTASTSASVFNNSGSSPEFSFSLIANSVGSGPGWETDIGIDEGNNIAANPLFVEDLDPANAPDTVGNFQLPACSPAIDRGINNALNIVDILDMAGNPRFHNATGADSAIVDMGANEFQGVAVMPEIICIDAMLELDGNGEVVIQVEELFEGIDSCGDLTGTVMDSTSVLLDCDDSGSHNFTVEVIDEVSLRNASCEVEVIVEDNMPPELNCPTSDTLYITQGCAVINLNYGQMVGVESNCPVTMSQFPYWGQVLSPQVYNQVVTAEDASGNTGQCSFDLHVLDTIAPTITCPADLTIYVDENCQVEIGDHTGDGTAADNCGIQSINQDFAASHSLTSAETLTLTLTATDESDNTANCSFAITAQDTTAPELVCDNSDITRYVDNNCEAVVGDLTHLATATDNCITEFTATQDISAASTMTAGDDQTVTLSVSDTTGWSAYCEILVTALDTIAPVASCDSSPVVLFVDENCEAELGDYTNRLTATDNCLDESDFSVSQDPLAGEELTAGDELTVTLTITVGNGWSEDCEIAVSVEDDTEPTLICDDSDITLAVNENCELLLGDWTHLATAEDNCLSAGNFTTTQNVSAETVLTEGQSVTVELTVSDTSGWSATCEIIVEAENQSEMDWLSDLPDNENLDCGMYSSEAELTAADYCDTIQVSAVADTTWGCMGIATIERSWTLGDLIHNQTVTYADETDPEWISSPLPQNATVDCDDVPEAPTLEATDNCSEATVSYAETIIPGSNPSEYVLLRSWTAEDECGNSISHQQMITVVDNAAPELNCPAEIIVDAEQSCSVPVPDLTGGVIATDNCSEEEDLSLIQIPVPGLTQISESITVFIIGEDEGGNSDFCSISLTLINLGEEVSISCPEDVTVEATPGECEANTGLIAQFTEGCEGVEVTNDYNSGGADASDTYPLGVTTVTFELFESGEWAASCTTSVEVNDVEVPAISCPADLTIEVNAPICEAEGIDPGEATAVSTCGQVSIINDAPTTFEIGTAIITYTATADNGQTAGCEQEITVEEGSELEITCPDSLVVKTDTGLCTATGLELGEATVSDICAEVTISNNAPEEFEIGVTIITYTAAGADGQEATCEQMITVEADEIPGIICPEDLEIETGSGNCEVEGVELGEASVELLCDELDSLYHDAPSSFAIGITTVTWTATSSNGYSMSCEQEVTVVDSTVLEITCPEDLILQTDAGSCTATGEEIGEGQTNDLCSDIELTSDGQSAYAVGVSIVTHTATATDGQTAICEQTVTVIDAEAPEITCPEDVEMVIPNGETEALIELEEATATDNCGVESISNSYNSGGSDATDQYSIGETIVVFTATDESGNTTECETEVIITEEEPEPEIYEVEGKVESWAGEPIVNVEMEVSGDESGSYFTNSDGSYDFEVTEGSTIIVTPEKDYNWLDGVSTLDLVFIQSHILGLILLDSPYKIIAADANNSGGVSTFDLVLVQSLILGQIDEIPGNTSWRFVPEDYTFSNPGNPLAENWPEQEVYPNVSGDQPDEDWVAIKTGDVTGEAGASGTRKMEGDYLIQAIQRTLEGGMLEMEVRIAEEMRMSGYQLEFQYDPSVMTYRAVDPKGSILGGLKSSNFHHDVDQGVIRMVWYNESGQALTTSDEMMRLQFTPRSDRIKMEDHIRIGSPGTIWNSHVIGSELDHFIPRLQWIEEGMGNQYALHQNEPNPFNGQTVIPFELPQDMKVNLEIIDATGKWLHSYHIDGRAGMNRYRINLEGDQSGMLYYRLSAGEWSGVKKMVLVE